MAFHGDSPLGDEDNDPFVTSPPVQNQPGHFRYSNFDSQLFALGPGSSADQAKRALEAHLAETDRRMEEAGKLGTALVNQRKQLTERLKEVEEMQIQGELTTDLKKKLVDIERDYNEVARESARAFLPKQRIPSNEAAIGSPFVPEGKGGRRSVSPSKFESQATGSPTKLSVPNRKLRNQPTNRVHDIEFAAEISTSLISQVRNLQALLAEREEELREIKVEKSKLELDAEGFQQRMKTLDESEHRYKDENWNLETQIHELLAAQRDANEREKKLSQTLAVLQADKNSTQRELDEIKVTHAKLVDEHTAAVKQHDIELGSVKRNMVMAEGERSAMQRKIEDLTSQNQELAKAFSLQRGRILERESNQGMSDEDFDTATDNITPEHSPPPSPVKGTPRHSMLESETLKTSLHHAQRTIQSLRTNVHREKTEKLELKRMLQDARDELEKSRGDPSGSSSRRNRKVDSREFKKPFRLGQLGGARASRSDIYLEDINWEDQNDPASPSRSPALRNTPSSGELPAVAESSDQFETANETSDAAFETANERATETEDFQTGAEELSDDDAPTETESAVASRGGGRIKRPPALALSQARNRFSYQSTASTSNDEDDDYTASDIKTPTAALPSQKMRLRVSRGAALSRRSRQASEEPTLQSSPASFAAGSSVSGTPQGASQSLFAELGDMDGSDDESMGATPSRRSVRSMTPASVARRASSPPPEVPALPRVIMVDSGMMTEPVELGPVPMPTSPDTVVGASTALERERPMSMNSVIELSQNDPGLSWLKSREQGNNNELSRPLSMSTFPESEDMDEKLSQFPSPPTSPPQIGAAPTPILAPPVTLSVSPIQAEEIEPLAEPEILPAAPPTLKLSSVQAEDIEPRSEPNVPPPALSISTMQAANIEPQSEPEVPPPTLNMSSIQVANIEPIAEPVVLPPPPPALSLSTVLGEHVEPQMGPETPVVVLSLSLSTIGAEHVSPVTEPQPPPLSLVFSTLRMEDVEPIAEPEQIAAPAVIPIPIPIVEPSSVAARSPPRELALSSIKTHHVTEPIVAPETTVASVPAPEPLSFSIIHTHHAVEPVAEPEAAPAPLSFSAIETRDVEPLFVEPTQPTRPILAFSRICGENVEPLAEPELPPPVLSVSAVTTQHAISPVEPEPLVLPGATAPILSMSSVWSEQVEPVTPPAEPEPEVVVPSLSMSSVWSEDVEPVAPVAPVAPVEPEVVIPSLGFSRISAVGTEPISPRSPKRSAYVFPRDEDLPRTPTNAVFGSVLARGRAKEPTTPTIAEDETRQSPSDTPNAETPESQRPFRELSSNSNVKPVRKQQQVAQMSDQGAQTSLTAETIEEILSLRSQSRPDYFSHQKSDSFGNASPGSPGTVRHRRSQESIGSVIRHKVKISEAAVDVDSASFRRPGSAASGRGSLHSHNLPPLPPNHKQAIEAARTGSSSDGQGTIGTIGTMGPPILPASAFNKNPGFRPRTPSGNGIRQAPPLSPVSVASISGRGTPTPRAAAGRAGSMHGTADVQSPTRFTARSRQSSVSSFASEVDARFNMHNGMGVGGGMGSHGFGPNTDPRMIQAITQTMIGEYLWKYTRKAGRGGMSERRHRRYFWVHPYTRTLYWSDGDPSTAGRAELRAKSVPIEAVRVVTDDNPMPPGLHRKSLVILSPGRTVKFTCTTGQRHETWFNALSYLLLRTNADDGQGEDDAAEDMAGGHITSEDVDEFNPQLFGGGVGGGRRAAPGPGSTTRARPPPSLSSYTSRGTRVDSPAPPNISLDVPTLTPTPHRKAKAKASGLSSSSAVGVAGGGGGGGAAAGANDSGSGSSSRPSVGTLSRLSGYWRSSGGISGTLSSLRSRSTVGGIGRDQLGVYGGVAAADEVHDSAEDLRLMYERQDRESDRLENVRACCDGKHDVGTLSKKGGHPHNHHHHHQPHGQHPGQSTTPTPAGTVGARA